MPAVPPIYHPVKSFTRRARRPARLPRLAILLCALTGLTALLTWIFAPSADALVNPLTVIESQVRKANMLIVLDTSGSMTGVPGGQFQDSTECGVDCDNGVNCRQGGVQGVCKAWTSRTCMADTDCQHGYCTADNTTICATNTDCPQSPGTCTATGGSCLSNADCAAQPGACTATGAACSAQSPCATVGYCTYGSNVLCSTSNPCVSPIGTCSTNSSVTCKTNADCPSGTSGGTCSNCHSWNCSCNTNTDCPMTMTCQFSGDQCRTTSDCPVYTSNVCSGGWNQGNPCTSSSQCYGYSCIAPPANTCSVGTPDVCNLPAGTCSSLKTNTCTTTTNTCAVPSNTCTLPPANTCQTPVSTTDTCIPSSHGTPGPIRMCVTSQLVCSQDSDCGTGDTCGPATSRTVIAKRAISQVVMDNYSLVNFGLMTFWQSGYYPYYQVPGGGTTTTITIYETQQQLQNAGCFTWNRQTNSGGPSATCTMNGRTMTLQSTADSRYRVRNGWFSWNRYDVDFCGLNCNMPNNLGWGTYQGSYYTYTQTIPPSLSTLYVSPTYGGQNITVGGNNYVYYTPLNNYYNGGAAPPINVANCGSACSSTCGGRWDTQLAPFLDTSDNLTNALAAANAITAQMALAADGGLLTYWGTPTGCTLQNNVSQTPNTSAYAYMQAVEQGYTSASPVLNIPADHLSCRSNYVLLITDGAANGPGDVDNNGNSICATTACSAANPKTAGCACKSVLAAYDLYHNLNVKVFVVGFSGDVSSGSPAVINNNIAQAGGTGTAYLATNEDQLNTALESAVYTAIAGNYSSSAGSTSAGTQQAVTVVNGTYALDSRMEFPSWQGHLYAYNVASGTPVLAWDGANGLTSAGAWDPAHNIYSSASWKSRRLYTWDGTNIVKVQVDWPTGNITNAAQLAALGMGATAAEAQSVAQWALGNPASGNPAVFGAIVNSTPIDVASPGNVALPGGNAFFVKYQNRPHLIYVGSSDQMLHAFFLMNTTVGTTSYQAGSEAFAFIPPDLLPNLRTLYAQGGQKMDPYQHIFGLADSPKVKSLCVSGCTSDATAVWKTLLLMPEGYGGQDSFMLDVTNPFGTNGLNDPPISVQWHTGYGNYAATYNNILGDTISLPAFLLNNTTTLDDYRVIFASGYGVTNGNTQQGRTLVMSSASSGAILATATTSTGAGCAQQYSALTDVATARDFATGQNDRLIAGYFGDTAGQLWRYTLTGGLSLAYNFTCNQPLHFAPTVVQLDRDSIYTTHAHEIYLVQVTNSNLDMDTTSLPPSQMIFAKEVAQYDTNGSLTGVAPDTTWGTSGKIVLTVGTNGICGATHLDSNGNVICDSAIPSTARPTSTPLGILTADGNGFQVLTMWYATPSNVCLTGQTYLTVHQMENNVVTQRLGYQVSSTNPATSPVVVGNRVFVFGGAGTYNDVTPFMPDGISAGSAIQASPYAGQFTRFSWTEVMQ